MILRKHISLYWSDCFLSPQATVEDPTCQFCLKTFSSKSNLKRHELIHQPDAPTYSCTFCDYKAIQKASVERHMKRTHSEALRSFSANYTRIIYLHYNFIKKLDQYSSMNILFGLRTSRDSWMCYVCKKSYSSAKNLRRHYLIHQLNAPKFKCEACSYQTLRKDKMIHHKRHVHGAGKI
ncbi:gastrula zinc finger protein XlCGF49.1-like [Centruroides vittatus]|uniref:gastrula zinc finger protein XlCGF49.1-like n=1 Tax=Centruroides vittatus TaxID=120091 RepID=UPI00350F927C